MNETHCNTVRICFRMWMPLKRNSALLERSVFKYLISLADWQTLKGNANGITAYILNEVSSRFGHMIKDGMFKKIFVPRELRVSRADAKGLNYNIMTASERFSLRKMYSNFTHATKPYRTKGSPSKKRFQSRTFDDVKSVRGFLLSEPSQV